MRWEIRGGIRMIDIQIKANEEQVFDSFNKKNTNLIEVASALLRLKQIEQVLIDLSFESEIEQEEIYEDG